MESWIVRLAVGSIALLDGSRGCSVDAALTSR